MAPLPLSILQTFHPARLRGQWQRRAFDLDPGALPEPLEPPGEGCFILTGSPRTGTSLATAALFQPPHVVTLVEPWAGMRLAPAPLFAHWRRRITEERAVAGGTLDFEQLEQGRVVRVPEGSSCTPVAVTERFHLGIKWPSFYRYLDRLPETKFVICVRHPYEVLGSMARLTGSSLQIGQDYDVPFNRRMNRVLRQRTSSPALRRIEMFDYVTERLARHFEDPNVFVLRYERWFDDPRSLLDSLGRFLGVDTSASPVVVNPPSEREPLDTAGRSLVRRHSRMAHRLGYDLY